MEQQITPPDSSKTGEIKPISVDFSASTAGLISSRLPFQWSFDPSQHMDKKYLNRLIVMQEDKLQNNKRRLMAKERE